MKKGTSHIWSDSWILFRRCMLISMRNKEALLVAIVTPICLMVLFGTVFGNITDVGEMNYIDFIVPGIVLQSIAQASQYSAIYVATDMAEGINDRFRSMSISRTAILIAHTATGMIRNTMTAFVILLTALLLGYRPQGDAMDWLLAGILLCLVNTAISLFGVLCGVVSKTPEGSSGLMFPLFVLPFLSSGFAPTETMNGVIRWISEVQPMTPIINSFRSLTLDLPLDHTLWIAFAWCIGLILVTYVALTHMYQRKISS